MNSISSKKALIVDDDALGCFLLKAHLEKMSINTQIAKSSSEAIRIIDKQPDIDFVFVDYHLPDMRGDKLIQHLTEYMPAIKCAIVSGNNAVDCNDMNIEIDAKRFITKPVTEQKLKMALTSFI